VGGLAVHATELAAALQRKGNEVHVFTRIGPDQKIYEVIDRVHHHRCSFAFNSDFIQEMNTMCKSMAHYFFETEKNGSFDIIHGHDWHVVNALNQIKKAKNRKVILTLHSNQFGRDGNKFHYGPAQHIRDIEWYGTYLADRVLVCSNVMKKETIWLYRVPEEKIGIIPNGIWAHKFDGFIDPWKDAKMKYGIGVYDPLILYVGRITTQKGPDLLLESVPYVLRECPDTKFVFVGDGYLRQRLKKRAKELHVNYSIRFPGYVSDLEKANLLKACECVVLPSRNEPFGIVVLEAWSSGKPVIATHGTGAGEIVWHNVTGLRVYQKPKSIAWGIKKILADLEKARWMGKKGRYAAETVFNWNNIAEQTLNIYREVRE